MFRYSQRVMRFILYVLLIIGLGGTAEGRETGIETILKNLVSAASNPYQQELTEVYSQRKYQPLWISPSSHLNEGGLALLNVLTNADLQGLNPKDYDQSELHWLHRTDQLFSEDQQVLRMNVLARFEVVLSKNFLKLLDHVTAGRLSPEHINGKWYLQDHRPSLTQIMVDAIDEGIVAMLTSLAGGHEGYAPLLEALKQYHRIKADGGWPNIAEGPLLAQGTKGTRVKALGRRLTATGDLHTMNNKSSFDQEVVEAVKKFQARHDMAMDGMVGPQTLKTLNVPVESRIQQILVNLERRRWMPRTFGPEYIMVNIPDFRLTAFRNGEPHLTMAVIVGKPMSQTPIFGDVLEYLVINPYWNVPRSITKEEILPKVQEDSAYLEQKNLEVVDRDGQPMERSLLTAENIEAGTIRIRQKPGPTNALGLVKFMFPNDHAIYLHDTPADHLFDASERDFSHGCIRVERPTDLAEFLLGEKWSRKDIMRTLESSERQAIQLPQSMPVYILYLTTWVAEDGTLQFRDDPYGHDERLWTSLQPILSTTTVQLEP